MKTKKIRPGMRVKDVASKETQMATNEEIKAMEDNLRAEMIRHDWYFDYSDDGRVWRRGNEHREKIATMFESYKAQIGVKAAVAFWNQHAPKDFQK
jgi:hypothetical protein